MSQNQNKDTVKDILKTVAVLAGCFILMAVVGTIAKPDYLKAEGSYSKWANEYLDDYEKPLLAYSYFQMLQESASYGVTQATVEGERQYVQLVWRNNEFALDALGPVSEELTLVATARGKELESFEEWSSLSIPNSIALTVRGDGLPFSARPAAIQDDHALVRPGYVAGEPALLQIERQGADVYQVYKIETEATRIPLTQEIPADKLQFEIAAYSMTIAEMASDDDPDYEALSSFSRDLKPGEADLEAPAKLNAEEGEGDYTALKLEQWVESAFTVEEIANLSIPSDAPSSDSTFGVALASRNGESLTIQLTYSEGFWRISLVEDGARVEELATVIYSDYPGYTPELATEAKVLSPELKPTPQPEPEPTPEPDVSFAPGDLSKP